MNKLNQLRQKLAEAEKDRDTWKIFSQGWQCRAVMAEETISEVQKDLVVIASESDTRKRFDHGISTIKKIGKYLKDVQESLKEMCINER